MLSRTMVSFAFSVLALVVAVTAFMVTFTYDDGFPEMKPKALWQALPQPGDLPEGWSITDAGPGGIGPGIYVQLQGPEPYYASFGFQVYPSASAARRDLEITRTSPDHLSDRRPVMLPPL